MATWTSKLEGFRPGTLRISGEKIPTLLGELAQADLQFWVDNPRIYSIVHASDEPLDQDQIQLELQNREHVKQLIQDIKHHGGLINPILVRDGDLAVLEGNSRLAAYRFLAQKDPIKFGEITSIVIPGDISQRLIYSYLNQEHIKGKSEWSPYEEAGIIYRLVQQGSTLDQLASELNIGVRVARRKYETYAFMIDHNEDIPSRWSYYDVYLRSQKVKKKREVEPALDNRIIQEIRGGKVTAQQFRDMLPEVCAHDKAFVSFVNGKTSLIGAYERLEEEGKTEDLAKLMKKMHERVRELKKDDFDGLSPKASKTVEYEMRQVIRKLTSLKQKVFGTGTA